MIGAAFVPQVPRSTAILPSPPQPSTMVFFTPCGSLLSQTYSLGNNMSINSGTLLILGCVTFFVVFVSIREYWRKTTMPPGPSPIPFVGNKWDLPPQKPWYKFQEWSKEYGSLVTMWTGQRPTVIIGDPQAACDLLDKRSSIYSSRPRFVVMGELFTNNDSLLTMPHGGKFKKTRKIFGTGLLQSALNNYRPIQEAESKRLVRDLMNSGENFAKHLDRYAASVMVCVAYGRRVDDLDDTVVQRIYERMQYMATLNVPGAFWAESFPALKWVPDFLAPWKREVKQRAAESSNMLFRLAKQVETRMARGDAPPSFAKTLWEKRMLNEKELSEREIAYAAGSLFGAGADTSSATLQSFILAMTVFPEVAAKAQEEIDAVVGSDRAPTWEDEPHLPYCAAILKETLRWRPVAVLGGTPHCSIKDDIYKGHHIPKGTTVMGNLWAIHHNEDYFTDSHRFMPERYLDPEIMNMVKPYPHRDGHSAFGWGKRICPGKRLAENSLFISITHILWGFKITKACDPATKAEITPNIFAYTNGFNSKPQPFKCIFTPRSEEHRQTILRDADSAEVFLERYRGD